MESEPVTVRCHSGFTYAQRPVSFDYKGRECQVAVVDRSWIEPGRRCFQLRTTDDRIFELCYHEVNDQWMASHIVIDNHRKTLLK